MNLSERGKRSICGRRHTDKPFVEYATLWLIKSQPSANPNLSPFHPAPFWALPTPHKQRSNWTPLIVGGARPLSTPSPQSPALPGDVYLPLAEAYPSTVHRNGAPPPSPRTPFYLTYLSSICVYKLVILL